MVVLLACVYGTTCFNGVAGHLSPEEEKFQRVLLEHQRDPTTLTFQYSLNDFFDYIINTIKFVMSDTGDLSIPLPDIAKTFNKGLIRGEVTGSRGYFRNIVSLQRTDDAELKMNGTILYMSASFGLQEFDAGFRSYSVELGNIFQMGDVSFKVAQNSLRMAISYDLLHICSLKVESLKFDDLTGVKIQVSGLGDFQSLVRIFTDWTTQAFKRTFKSAVNTQMKNNINAALKGLMGSFCKGD